MWVVSVRTLCSRMKSENFTRSQQVFEIRCLRGKPLSNRPVISIVCIGTITVAMYAT